MFYDIKLSPSEAKWANKSALLAFFVLLGVKAVFIKSAWTGMEENKKQFEMLLIQSLMILALILRLPYVLNGNLSLVKIQSLVLLVLGLFGIILFSIPYFNDKKTESG